MKKPTKKDEYRELMNMMNVNAKTLGLDVDCSIRFMQPGKELKHGKRIYVFKVIEKRIKHDFYISLSTDPSQIGIIDGCQSFLTAEDTAKLIEFIIKYRSAFLKFYFDMYMDLDELLDLMAAVDAKTSLSK